MERKALLDLITRYLKTHPIVAILGPRQCGKTTLARKYIAQHGDGDRENYFDLENPADRQRLQNPKLALENLKGLITIDEIQKQPDLFPLLRVLVDREENPCKYLILGSASRELLRQSSQTLAGRIAFIELTPFSSRETKELNTLWLRGGFPKSYLAHNPSESFEWRESYITTYLEQDIPNLGIHIPPNTLRRFWSMLTHYHGNILNASELGRSFGVSDMTVRRYLDILIGTFMIRQLLPWHENLKKTAGKSTKNIF